MKIDDINNYVNEHHMLKSLNQQLFDENERLNAIIDELEEKIDKAIEYLKTFHFIDNIRVLDIKEYEKLLEILGDKE